MPGFSNAKCGVPGLRQSTAAPAEAGALHDLSGLYLLANAGVTPELRMKLTGHSSERVHDGSTHHELEVLKSAMAKLPSLNS